VHSRSLSRIFFQCLRNWGQSVPVAPYPSCTVFFDQFLYRIPFSFNITAKRPEFLKMLTIQIQRVSPTVREPAGAIRTFHGNLLM
jgi:hypothetical protein